MQSIFQLERRLKSAVTSAIHDGYYCMRLAEIFNERTRGNGQPPKVVSHLSIYDTGEQNTYSGFGPIFDNFKRTSQIPKIWGFGETAASFFWWKFQNSTFEENEIWWDFLWNGLWLSYKYGQLMLITHIFKNLSKYELRTF